MEAIGKDEAFKFMSPLPYTLITSLDKNNKPNILGVAWVTRTSWEPFLVLISVDHGRYSHEGIQLHKEFVINYPSKEQKEIAWLAGTKSGRDIDKIKAGHMELIDSLVVKVPTLNQATVAFECKVISEHTTGDHTVFVGEVVATRGRPDRTSTLFCNFKYELIALDNSGTIQA